MSRLITAISRSVPYCLHRSPARRKRSCMKPPSVDHCMVRSWAIVPPVAMTSWHLFSNCLLSLVWEYRGGPHMRSLISIEFPVPEMEPESAHVASAVSVPYLQCGDCNPAPPRQHSPIRRYSGYSATPWYVLIQLPNVIDTISKRWRSTEEARTCEA